MNKECVLEEEGNFIITMFFLLFIIPERLRESELVWTSLGQSKLVCTSLGDSRKDFNQF